ncbi:MAG: ParB/RepB/Spo0J family partition protein [Planctomycetia bacterium]|nr:ParB/RepB/Spo0J family partition protein [Planctomycetia bacterium]
MDDQNTSIAFPQSPESQNQPLEQPPEGVAIPRRRLGRGISSLLGSLGEPALMQEAPATGDTGAGEFGLIDEALISRNPYQPRREFGDEGLAEMVESISQHGILQPLLVRPFEGGYQLIAGERRLLAARKAGVSKVPCRVVALDDKGVCEVAIIENVQRADLSDLEKAQAFQEYLDKFGGTIEDLAARLGKNRSTISNCLRLLELPDQVKIALSSGRISAGHARALLPLEEESDQIAMCRKIESEKLSVRQTEDEIRVKLHSADNEGTIPFQAPAGKGKTSGSITVGNHVLELQQQLRELLGAKVEIRLKGKDSGKMVIHFTSNDEFDRIVGFLRKAS